MTANSIKIIKKAKWIYDTVCCINAFLIDVAKQYQILQIVEYMIEECKVMDKCFNQSSKSVPQMSWSNMYGKWGSDWKQWKDSGWFRSWLE